MTLHAVVGVSGNTGGATARALMQRGSRVRAIVRDPCKGEAWVARGAEVAVADLADAASLSAAFAGADSAYALNPPAYVLPDMFARARVLAESILEAVRRSRLPHLVVLSSIGAHRTSGNGNIRTNWIFEQILEEVPGSVTFLRPAYFMENWAWVAAEASGQGVLPSFLSPPERPLAMVSVADVGEVAAGVMLDGSAGTRVIELAGPNDYSPQNAAEAFAKALERAVRVAVVPEAEWPGVLEGSHFSPRTIESWVELFRAFNAGRIAFERSSPLRGRVGLDEAIGAIVRGM